MGCACNKNKRQYEVVAENGKVVFTSGIEATANTVAKRYPGSTVREQPKATAANGKG
ncbi:hypothetical protein [Streptomyces sp. 2P-4]|uniref:hypothetical protein n=1 Tax=Streptomyces sp. 2P-4 TaxID=2931974 RepID=UPI0025415AF6|nr:hypothetical protein [Streptomyces sp. 2P-4]